jgi:hypothetical protein
MRRAAVRSAAGQFLIFFENSPIGENLKNLLANISERARCSRSGAPWWASAALLSTTPPPAAPAKALAGKSDLDVLELGKR